MKACAFPNFCRQGGDGRYAEHGHHSAGAFEGGFAEAVRMTVQDQFGSLSADDSGKGLLIGQAPPAVDSARHRGVVYEDHPKEAFDRCLLQYLLEALQLFRPEGAGGQKGRCRAGRRQADDRHLAAPSQDRRCFEGSRGAAGFRFRMVRGHIRFQTESVVQPGHGNAGVMVAGDQGDAIRPAQLYQQICGSFEVRHVAGVGQVTGDDDVIHCFVGKRLLQPGQEVDAMPVPAVQQPAEVAQRALAEKITGPHVAGIEQMQIGKVGNTEMPVGSAR